MPSKYAERRAECAKLRADWCNGRTDSLAGFVSWAPSPRQRVRRSYLMAGGWDGWGTWMWIEPIAVTLLEELGMQPESIGILLAHKQRITPEWIDTIVMSHGPTCPRMVYEIDGVCKVVCGGESTGNARFA